MVGHHWSCAAVLSLRERIKDPNSSLVPFHFDFKPCPAEKGEGLASKKTV